MNIYPPLSIIKIIILLVRIYSLQYLYSIEIIRNRILLHSLEHRFEFKQLELQEA